MFRKIVLAFDGSEHAKRAFDVAAEIALGFGAALDIVQVVTHQHAPEAVAAFKSGHGDFLEQTQPVTEQLISEGAAHLVVSMGEATGPVPFTSYMTTPAFLKREPDVMLRFTRAVYRTQRWLAAAPAAKGKSRFDPVA